MANANAVFFLIFLLGPLHPTVQNHPEFQFTSTVFMSMAAKLSDIDDQKSGVNIWTEGHTLTPPSSWNGLEETGIRQCPLPITIPVSFKEDNT